MNVFIIIILGIIQGACEFLPVSSSGHLVVFYNFFNVYDNTIILSIILHVATLLAVILLYRKQLFLLVKKPLCKTNYLLLTATIPTVIMVLIFKKFIEESFSGEYVIICFLITAAMLMLSEYLYKKRNYRQKSVVFTTSNHGLLSEASVYSYNITYLQAFIIGVAQGVATIPGISRSGSTISAGLVSGVNKHDAANFSFLLSVPIIIASLFYELYNLRGQQIVLNFSVFELFIGFVVSFVVGIFCLKVMLDFVKKQKLYVFSIYLVLLAAFLLLNKHVFYWF